MTGFRRGDDVQTLEVHMRGMWFGLLASLLSPAEARDHQGSGLQVQQIQVWAERDGLRLHVETNDAQFQRLARQGITPTLIVEIPRGGAIPRRVEIPITHAALESSIPMPYLDGGGSRYWPPDDVRISVRGGNAREQISWLDLGIVQVTRLDLRLQEPQHVALPVSHWAGDPDVIRACGSAFLSATSKTACTDKVDRAAISPVATIQACDSAFVSDADALACLSASLDAASAHEPPTVISACDSAFVGSADTLQCIQAAVSSFTAPNALIASCDNAFVGSEDTLQCIRTAAPSTQEPSSWIQACDTAILSPTATLQCMAAAAKYRSNPVPTVQACDDANTGDAAVVSCVERGTR